MTRRRTAIIILLVLSCTSTLSAQAKPKRWKKVWVISALAVAGATLLDARSSAGRYELNPLLRDSSGRFSPSRGIALKSGVTAGALLLQVLAARKKPDAYRTSSIVNFGMTGVFSAVAARNRGVTPSAGPGYTPR